MTINLVVDCLENAAIKNIAVHSPLVDGSKTARRCRDADNSCGVV